MYAKEVTRRAFLQAALVGAGLAGCRYVRLPMTQKTSPYLIVDGHTDIAWNALMYKRDPRRSAFEIRRNEAGTDIPRYNGECLIGLPEWLEGGVVAIFATIFVMPASASHTAGEETYSTPQEAAQIARRELDFYRSLTQEEPRLRLLYKKEDLDAVLEAKKNGNPLVGLAMLMESADPIFSMEDLPAWVEGGVHLIGPAWHATRYCGGTGEPGGLTADGRSLLKSMAELKLTLDISHMAELACHQALDSYGGALIASHANPWRFCPTDRGLKDDAIRSLAQRDGVMGIVLFNRFLNPDWSEGARRSLVPLSTVADAVDYVAQLTGSARHVAIGSDFDGGFGMSAAPEGLDSVADLWKIGQALEERGYSSEDVAAVMGGNWLRVLRAAL